VPAAGGNAAGLSTRLSATNPASPGSAAAPAAGGTASAGGSPLETKLPAGRSELGDRIFAVRAENEVRVHFDTEMERTRRRDKFERMLRRTLPAVYGASADSALAALPEGFLTAFGDLLNEMPSGGVRIPVRDGAVIMVWPELSPGRDGPLVTAYRTVVQR
jgi:hypothetical protein